MRAKKLLFLFSSICLAVVVATLSLPCGAKEASALEPTVIMRFSTIQEPSNTAIVEMVKTLDEITAKTKGHIKFEKFYGTESGLKGKEYIHALERGLMDMAVVGFPVSSFEYPWLGLVGDPFMTPNPAMRQIVIKALTPMYDDFFAEHGIVSLSYPISLSAYIMLYTTKEIKSLSDFKGKLIRVYDPGGKRTIQMLGAKPVSIEKSAVYMALQRKTIDGAITGTQAAKVESLAEVAKYEMKLFVQNVVWAICVSKKAWDKLSTDQQKIVRDTFTEWEKSYWSKANDPAMQEAEFDYAKKNGVTISELPPDAKAVSMGPIRDAVLNDYLERCSAQGKQVAAKAKQAVDLWKAALVKAGY